jgi:hypothetical protein
VSETHAPRRRRLVGAAGVASLIGAIAMLGLVVSAGVGRSARTNAEAPPVAAPLLPAVPPAPSLATDATASEAPGAPPTDGSSKRTLAPPRLHPRSGCATPYTIDGRGLRHYKPECI